MMTDFSCHAVNFCHQASHLAYTEFLPSPILSYISCHDFYHGILSKNSIKLCASTTKTNLQTGLHLVNSHQPITAQCLPQNRTKFKQTLLFVSQFFGNFSHTINFCEPIFCLLCVIGYNNNTPILTVPY